jgi:hypothetical protein
VVHYSQLNETIIAKETKDGPNLYLPALDESRNYEEVKELRVMQYNIRNLETRDTAMKAAIAAGKEQKEIADLAPKDPAHRKWVAQQIEKVNPDVLFLDEIHGFHSLEDFAKQDLQGQYRPLMIKGNDSRIDIGILVKKDLPLDVEVQSHVDRKFFNEIQKAKTPIFHRDSPVVILRRKGTSHAEKPVLFLQPEHLKSKRPSPHDPHSAYARANEIKGLLNITQETQAKYPGVPNGIMGDLNDDWRDSMEFAAMRPRVVNTFDLSQSPIPEGERATQYHWRTHVDPKIPRSVPFNEIPDWAITRTPDHHQLDVSLVSPATAKMGVVKDAGIVPYLGPDGKELPPPATYDIREKNFPSDHRAVFTIFDFLKLRAIAGDPPKSLP